MKFDHVDSGTFQLTESDQTTFQNICSQFPKLSRIEKIVVIFLVPLGTP